MQTSIAQSSRKIWLAIWLIAHPSAEYAQAGINNTKIALSKQNPLMRSSTLPVAQVSGLKAIGIAIFLQ